MYFEDFKFNRKPFDNTSDPDFYYLSDATRKICRRITDAIAQRVPYVILSGEPGTGKTTLLNWLMATGSANVHWIFISQTSLTWQELLPAVGRAVAIPETDNTSENIANRISDRLKQFMAQAIAPVLIIDEAQCLTDTSLKALCQWRAWLGTRSAGLTIILAGQTKLTQSLADSQLIEFNSDISAHYRLKKLSQDECGAMIAHRLETAGYFGPTLFNEKTLHTVFKLSGGIPRRVNTICDLAMFTANTEAGQSVSPEDIQNISEYIFIKAQDSQLKNGSVKSLSPESESLSLSRSTPSYDQRGSRLLSLSDPRRWRQRLATLQSNIARQLKYLWAWWPRSWPWKRTIAGWLKERSTRWQSICWPWACALASLLIIMVISYVQFHAPVSQPVQPLVADSRPAGQAVMLKIETDLLEIASDIEPVYLTLPAETNTRLVRETVAVASLKEAVLEALEIVEVLPVPELLIYKGEIEKEVKVNTMETVKSVEAGAIIHETMNAENQIEADITAVAKSVPNNPDKSAPRSIPTSSAQKTPVHLAAPSQPPAKKTPDTIKKIKPATSTQTAKSKKSNPASKALFHAIQDGNIDWVRKVLSEGAEVDALLFKNNTPLTMAAGRGHRGHLEIVQVLLDRGAAINRPTPAGETALMKAAWSCHLVMTEWLLNRGARINMQNQEGRTSLFYASIMGRSDIVNLLLDHGVRLDLPDQDGRTPLTAAAWNNHQKIVRNLLSHGADPNHKDRDGWTPLMYAAFEGHTEVVQMLISHGADLTLKNSADQSSVDLATQQGHTALYAIVSNYSQQ